MDGYAEMRLQNKFDLLEQKVKILESALKIYGDRKNWSRKIMRQGREVYMPKNVISATGPELAEEALKAESPK